MPWQGINRIKALSSSPSFPYRTCIHIHTCTWFILCTHFHSRDIVSLWFSLHTQKFKSKLIYELIERTFYVSLAVFSWMQSISTDNLSSHSLLPARLSLNQSHRLVRSYKSFWSCFWMPIVFNTEPIIKYLAFVGIYWIY